MIFFTDNYQDRSTDDGYQFEFFCRRCGNGYSSSFQHSATGFGGRLLRLGGDMLGGNIGEKAQQLGWDAEFMRDTVRGSTRDKALAKAVRWAGGNQPGARRRGIRSGGGAQRRAHDRRQVRTWRGCARQVAGH